MVRKLMLLCVLLSVVPALVFAQDGKLRGRVTDKETGEPLIGVNIVLEGTTLGAATDVNGDYIVLGIPPGVYTVRVSYIGYQPLVVSNIRISAGMTTTRDFQLQSTALEVEALEIVAQRPIVQRNTTNTVRMTTQEDIQHIPIRGLQNIIALNAGTVQQDGELHVRGGRAGEIAYYVDGATATNPLFNSENISVIQEAIEEIQLQAGGYTAEFGGANSAVVRTTVRTGGPEFKATVDYRTDDFAHAGDTFLGTHSYGYRNGVVTLSGPLPGMDKLRYFLAYQFNGMRDRNPSFITPFRFSGLTDDGFEGRAVGDSLPGDVAFLENHLPNNWYRDHTIQGTMVYDMSAHLKFRLTGSYSHDLRRNGFFNFRQALTNLFWEREYLSRTKRGLLSLKVTHLINPKTFYEFNINYSARSFKSYDPVFGDNWQAYVDSVENAKHGFTGWQDRYLGPPNYSTINNFEFTPPHAPINSYQINSQSSIGASVDFTSQVTSNWELKAGGRFDYWTMRLYSVGGIRQALTFLYGIDGNTPRTFENERERQIRLTKAGFFNYYGYDVDGNKVDSGPGGPRHPFFASLYVQNKLEFRDLIINLGLRYERFDIKAYRPDNLANPKFDEKLDWIDESSLVTTEAYEYLLPRVTFSFPVTDRTVFYALYGKYAQMPSLNQVYSGLRSLSQTVSPVTRSPYGFFGQLAGFTAKPERTTSYELGLRQALTDNFAFTITSFYRDLRDQLRWDRVYGEDGSVLFSGLANNDFGTVKGIELTLELRRTKRLAGRVNYTLSDARGTGSETRSTRVAVSDATIARYPTLIYPFDYNQRHRGTIMLDYRFAKGDGGWLSGSGLNMILYFNSGHSYTKIKEPQDLGQASPWTIGMRATADPRGRIPDEPINSSTTPWNFNIDVTLNKVFYFGNFNVEVYANILNLLNTKNIINVYPTTGTAEDDGWLRSPLAAQFYEIPNYVDFYTTVNLQNRWAYQWATGNDIYGTPRQIRFGIKFEF